MLANRMDFKRLPFTLHLGISTCSYGVFVWCACAWVDCLSLIIYPNKYSQETQGREASGRVWRYHTYDPFAHSWAGTRRTCHKRPRSRSAGKSETSPQTLQTGHRPAMGQWSIQDSQDSRQAQQSQSKGPTPARFLNRSLRNSPSKQPSKQRP